MFIIFGVMKKYTLLFIALFIISCSDNDDTELKPFYVADNGVTIKARDWVTVGTSAELNGVTYTAVDLASLEQWINDDKDLSKVVTTKVETIGNSPVAVLFAKDNKVGTAKIKGIEGWDVSNWTDMSGLFYSTEKVNVDLSGWDVSKVTECNGLTGNFNAYNWPESKRPNFTNCNPD